MDIALLMEFMWINKRQKQNVHLKSTGITEGPYPELHSTVEKEVRGEKKIKFSWSAGNTIVRLLFHTLRLIYAAGRKLHVITKLQGPHHWKMKTPSCFPSLLAQEEFSPCQGFCMHPSPNIWELTPTWLETERIWEEF